MVVFDIATEVIRLAIEQGHTKANKHGINWEGLKTKSGKVKFMKSSIPETTIQEIANVEECLSVKSKASKEVHIKDNALINATDQRQKCTVEFTETNTSVATVWLNNWLTNTLKEKKKCFSKISLKPKLQCGLYMPEQTRCKVQIPCKEAIPSNVDIDNGVKAPIEVIKTITKERGVLKLDYYLWGQVSVQAWGKPYTLVINDILDPKHNPQFSRENIVVKRNKSIAAQEEIQAVMKYEILGNYEIETTKFELNIKIPNCILKRPVYTEKALKCCCDTARVPDAELCNNLKPLTNRNLAKVIFRWRRILYSFRNDGTENQELWERLLKSKTEISQTAGKCHKYAMNYIDKFLLSILLWRDEVTHIEDINDKYVGNGKTWQLAKQLYDFGVPVPVFGFLLEGKPETNCPVHKFLQGGLPEIKTFNKQLQEKMNSTLPDRIIERLVNRIDEDDGWLSMALYLGIDVVNIKSLATNTHNFKDLNERRITIWKLWRIKRRKLGECTMLNLCRQLNEMLISKKVFNFMWLHSESTP